MKKSVLILSVLFFANACSVCDKTEKAGTDESTRGRLIEKADEKDQGQSSYKTRHGRTGMLRSRLQHNNAE